MQVTRPLGERHQPAGKIQLPEPQTANKSSPALHGGRAALFACQTLATSFALELGVDVREDAVERAAQRTHDRDNPTGAAIPAAIRPYSMAVAPDSSLTKRLIEVMRSLRSFGSRSQKLQTHRPPTPPHSSPPVELLARN